MRSLIGWRYRKADVETCWKCIELDPHAVVLAPSSSWSRFRFIELCKDNSAAEDETVLIKTSPEHRAFAKDFLARIQGDVSEAKEDG